MNRLIDWYTLNKPHVKSFVVFPGDFKTLGKMAGSGGIYKTETGFTYRGFEISQVGVDTQPEKPV